MFRIEITEIYTIPRGAVGTALVGTKVIRHVLLRELETLDLAKVLWAINGIQEKRNYKKNREERR